MLVTKRTTNLEIRGSWGIKLIAQVHRASVQDLFDVLESLLTKFSAKR
jgi:hypothetical protein